MYIFYIGVTFAQLYKHWTKTNFQKNQLVFNFNPTKFPNNVIDFLNLKSRKATL